jgi:putative transcriptional regulator
VNKKLFAELVASMAQMNEVVRGERAPSREFHVDPIATKALRSKIGLSQFPARRLNRKARVD